MQRCAIDPEQVPPDILERVATTGVFVNPTDREFQHGYFPKISDIEALFAAVGFEKLDLFSIRGIVFGSESELERIGELSPPSAAAFSDALEATSRLEAVVSLSGHAILAMQRPSSDAD